MMSSAPTPRTPKGWVRLLLSIVGWAALGFVALGTIVWVFFSSYGLTRCSGVPADRGCLRCTCPPVLCRPSS